MAQTITGKVRSEWVVNKKEQVHSLGDRGTHIPYPVADEASAVMTATDRPGATPRVIPRSEWQFARLEYGKPVPSREMVYFAAGFEPGKIYDVTYTAQDPTLVGLGPTGVRDLISFLKYENNGVVLLGDSRRFIKRAIGFGTSQSGRFLRTFLYYGFNKDEKGRKVFDGIWSHVAGGGRGSFNHRFAQPSRDGHPMLNLFYPTDIFPFTDTEQTDEGVTDSILARAVADKVAPKIFYTNGSYEYWGRAASLIHTTVDGKRDVAPPADTRIYYLTGTQHGAGNFPARINNTRYPANPNDYRFAMRGLLRAMNSWIADGKQPPASAHPAIAKDDLVAPGAVQFPKLNGVDMSKNWQMAWRADYGPDFRTKGIVAKEPPDIGKPFAILVPQVDTDGNEKAGIRLPDVEVPLGTFAGWNLRSVEIGNPTEYNNMVGSFFQFAKTKTDRAKTRDPRPSIEERYRSRDEYLGKIRESAKKLAASGYVLESDVTLLEQRAAGQWDYFQR